MSARPARRAVRRAVVESASSSSEADDTPTPRPTIKSRKQVASRSSFDGTETPASTRTTRARSVTRSAAPATKTPSRRAPLAESTMQTPSATRRLPSKTRRVSLVKEGFQTHAGKENDEPIEVAVAETLSLPMPPPASVMPAPMAPLETQKAIRAARLSMEQLDVPPLHAESMQLATPIQEGPATRIVIAKLVLENFKSYAGIQKIGPFHKSFSAVVGPNGSGKSNVIDSLLFVFGFRAAKMRQGKISALIHHSAAHPDLEFCSVEVHFERIFDDVQDPEDYRVVPDSKIVVARKAYKSNASKYTINGKDSSFTEVTTLLKNSGIDLDHKRFLILQGEVESIAQMRPKAATEHDDGLLEYLEDIIGTSR